MSEITLVRQPGEISKADLEAARRVLFGLIDGLGDKGRRQWRRFFNGLMRLQPGEMVAIHTHKERTGWFHRKHMLMEQRVFEHQEKFEDFEGFRVWLKVGSGFVDWYPGPKGGVIPVPRSISFAKLEDGDMWELHLQMIAFLRTAHAQQTLWKHLDPASRTEMLEMVIAGFEEQ